MGLSAGGFFKNFVKGAAQQYNTNVAYVEQQKIEEERAKKKEARQFASDKKLKELELEHKSQLQGLKNEKEKKIFGEYEYKDSSKPKLTLSVPKTTVFPTAKDKYSKALGMYQNLDFDQLKKELTPDAYRSLIDDTISNYTGFSTVTDGKTEGTKVNVSYNARFYPKIQKNADLMEALSVQINRHVDWTKNYIKNAQPNSIISDKVDFKVEPNSVTMSVKGFYGLDSGQKFFKPEDVKTAAQITGTKDGVIEFMNQKQKLMERETLKAQKKFGTDAPLFTGSDYINAAAVAKKAISTLPRSQLNELSPMVGITIRDAVLQLPNGRAIVNDPQVFHDLVRTLLPPGANPPLMQINSQAALRGKQAMFIKKFGPKIGAGIAGNSVSKADQAGRRYQRANSINILVDAGAGTGAAAQTESYFVGLAEQSKQFFTRMTGYEFTQTSQQVKDILTSGQEKANQETDPVKREIILRDAVLKYNTTLMVFDIATMAQDAGGGFTAGGSTVRLSDGDVRLSSQALAGRLLEIPGAVQAVAGIIAEFAEKEMVIFDMLANGDMEDARAGLVMLNAYRGELGSFVQALQDQRFSEILPTLKDGAKEDEEINLQKLISKGKKDNEVKKGAGTKSNKKINNLEDFN